MARFILIFTLFISSFLQAQTLDIQSESAHVAFNYVNKNTAGTLENVKADITLNFTGLKQSVISGTADVTTLSTGNDGRDKHLKSEDFFDAEKYPTMKFESNRIYLLDGKYFVRGMLTIKETTEEVTLELLATDTEITLSTTIYALDFGVALKKNREKSKVEISIVILI